ncbi:MAG: hypothetical protein U1E73_04560 [Planctomycetota bacterium]
MPLARALGGGALVAAAALAAAAAPLWTYALTLASCGLPHVLVELRYVDQRFAARVPRRGVVLLGLGLVGIAALRAAGIGGIGSGAGRVLGELVVGAALVAIVLPLAWRTRAGPAALALGAAIAGGAAFAPLETLVLLSLLHNLTPVGFLAERLRGRDRARALAACAVVFGAVPLALLLGAGELLPAGLAMAPEAAGPFGAGDLDQNLPVFVPSPWLGKESGDRLFAAAAFLQCMHYAVVLGVLPRLGGGGEAARAAVPWPRPTRLLPFVAIAGALALLGFASDFVGARAAYGVFAAVHAWLELPVLALACGLPPRVAAAEAVAA